MPLLALKLVLTPLLIGGATLAARRWGPLVGGWLVALPLTSGPVLLFLALDHGPSFAAEAAVGALLGLAAIVGFSLAYAAISPRGPWPSLGAAVVAYVVVGAVLRPLAEAPFARPRRRWSSPRSPSRSGDPAAPPAGRGDAVRPPGTSRHGWSWARPWSWA